MMVSRSRRHYFATTETHPPLPSPNRSASYSQTLQQQPCNGSDPNSNSPSRQQYRRLIAHNSNKIRRPSSSSEQPKAEHSARLGEDCGGASHGEVTDYSDSDTSENCHHHRRNDRQTNIGFESDHDPAHVSFFTLWCLMSQMFFSILPFRSSDRKDHCDNISVMPHHQGDAESIVSVDYSANMSLKSASDDEDDVMTTPQHHKEAGSTCFNILCRSHHGAQQQYHPQLNHRRHGAMGAAGCLTICRGSSRLSRKNILIGVAIMAFGLMTMFSNKFWTFDNANNSNGSSPHAARQSHPNTRIAADDDDDSIMVNSQSSHSSLPKSLLHNRLSFGATNPESTQPLSSTPGAAVLRDVTEGYLSWTEQVGRSARFPSVEERVKHYMSSWYLPSCPDNDLGRIEYNYVAPQKQASSTVDHPEPPLLLVREALVPQQPAQRVFRVAPQEKVGQRIFYWLHRPNNNATLMACATEFCRDTVELLQPVVEWAQLEQDKRNELERQKLLHEQHAQKKIIHLQQLDKAQDEGEIPPPIPTLLQFGDTETTDAFAPALGTAQSYPHVPFFRKFRHALTKADIQRMTSSTTVVDSSSCIPSQRHRLFPSSNAHSVTRLEPILWMLTYERHYALVKHVLMEDITPWEDKVPKAVFRGSLTGTKNHPLYSEAQLEIMEPRDRCMSIPRCKLALDAANSPWIDAKLFQRKGDYGGMPEEIDGVSIVGNKMILSESMQYQSIIMLEGHDLSAGLKWALLSSSVVLTPPPTFASWAMEDLLEPWVHYVPIVVDDIHDIEQKVSWVAHHPEEAQRIAHSGRLWILDLLFHPQAAADNDTIEREIVQRYQAHFRYAPDLVA